MTSLESESDVIRLCNYNDKLDGEYEIIINNWGMTVRRYYINDKLIIDNFNFKIKFCLLKFKDLLKNKIKKPRYDLLDKHFIPDISNIIISYIFTLSKLNKNGKRILL